MKENRFKIIFYTKENGENPLLDFINKQSTKLQIKLAKYIDTLSENGFNIARLYSKKIDDDIFELRILFNGNYIRILYFYYLNNSIVLTNGFIKKTDKTPECEIDKANFFRKDWIRRSKYEKKD